MRTLLDISKGNLKQVELNFRNITSDEVQLNIIGYHLQQNIEK